MYAIRSYYERRKSGNVTGPIKREETERFIELKEYAKKHAGCAEILKEMEEAEDSVAEEDEFMPENYADIDSVITSYSIHYTKLYDLFPYLVLVRRDHLMSC